MFGGETTCSQTSPRSSDIEDSRLPYDSSGCVSLQRSGEQTEVASSLHVHPVALGEQREDAVRVVRGDRLPVLRGQVAVHDRRLGALGRVVDRVGVLEPGGVVRKLSEARVALLVQLVVLVHQRVGGQLVQQHHHDRRARHAPDRAGARLVREGELRDLPAQQEQQQEHERGRREHVQERADRLGTRPERRDRGADRHGQHDQHGVRGVDRLLQRLRGDQGGERAEEDDVRALSEPRVGSARASSSIPSRSSGGSTTSSTEKLMMSKPVEPRAAKNSGLSFSRSKSGCATANVQRTARFR